MQQLLSARETGLRTHGLSSHEQEGLETILLVSHIENQATGAEITSRDASAQVNEFILRVARTYASINNPSVISASRTLVAHVSHYSALSSFEMNKFQIMTSLRHASTALQSKGITLGTQ